MLKWRDAEPLFLGQCARLCESAQRLLARGSRRRMPVDSVARMCEFMHGYALCNIVAPHEKNAAGKQSTFPAVLPVLRIVFLRPHHSGDGADMSSDGCCECMRISVEVLLCTCLRLALHSSTAQSKMPASMRDTSQRHACYKGLTSHITLHSTFMALARAIPAYFQNPPHSHKQSPGNRRRTT